MESEALLLHTASKIIEHARYDIGTNRANLSIEMTDPGEFSNNSESNIPKSMAVLCTNNYYFKKCNQKRPHFSKSS